MKTLTYSRLLSLPTFEERYEYLKLFGTVAGQTFGGDRWLNQMFYSSTEWKHFRDDIILRDEGCDLAMPDRPIHGRIILHHLNPITKDDIQHDGLYLFDPENVVCVSHLTHNAIHYGDSSLLFAEPLIRKPNDTCPWKGGLL